MVQTIQDHFTIKYNRREQNHKSKWT